MLLSYSTDHSSMANIINLSSTHLLSPSFSPQITPTLSFNFHPNSSSTNLRPISLKPYHPRKPQSWLVAMAVKNLADTSPVTVTPENDEVTGEELPSGAGVYAVYDKNGELQFIGLSRNIAATVSAHRKSVPELCGSVKVRFSVLN